MEPRPPTATRILIAAGFALSCFALALFLWIAFGGPIPLQPEGYRFEVPFPEGTQRPHVRGPVTEGDPARPGVRRADLGGVRRQGQADRPRRPQRCDRDHRAGF